MTPKTKKKAKKKNKTENSGITFSNFQVQYRLVGIAHGQEFELEKYDLFDSTSEEPAREIYEQIVKVS